MLKNYYYIYTTQELKITLLKIINKRVFLFHITKKPTITHRSSLKSKMNLLENSVVKLLGLALKVEEN